ncbi:MAG: hypothetical protein KKF68_01190 [Nanoarchaeota archaeon]|nr:hypothetical protein [Nanoarchaeota archaeon]
MEDEKRRMYVELVQKGFNAPGGRANLTLEFYDTLELPLSEQRALMTAVGNYLNGGKSVLDASSRIFEIDERDVDRICAKWKVCRDS